jgi:hypothetical protein
MDNQTPTTNPVGQVTNPTPAPSPLPAASSPSPQIAQSGGMLKKIVIGLIILVILVVVGGGAFYYMTMNQSSPASQTRTPITTYIKTPASPQDTLEQQVNQIDVKPIEGALQAVDQDINSINATASASPVSK